LKGKKKKVINPRGHTTGNLTLQKLILKHCLNVLTPEVALLAFMDYSTGRNKVQLCKYADLTFTGTFLCLPPA